MRAHCFLLSLLLAAPTMAEVGPAKSGQFLDKTWVTFPTKLGEFVLVRQGYGPAQLLTGVSLDYDLSGLPDGSAFDIYVFPQGRSSQEAGIKRALADITDGVRAQEANHVYQNVVFGDVVDFSIPGAPATAVIDTDKSDDESVAALAKSMSAPASAASASRSQSASENDPKAKVIAELVDDAPTVGRKIKLSFLYKDGTQKQSLGYAFYRHLFLITVRFTTPANGMSAEQFEALGDRAVRALVPAIDIENFGECGDMTINVSSDAPTKAQTQALSEGLMGELLRVKRENCARSEPAQPEPVPADHGREILTYPAGLWNADPKP
jgi:hypothetical protein